MSDRRWERLEEAFARAVERPEEEWEAVVAEACGDDLRLRAEVMELLRGMEPSARFMDRLAARIGLPREEPEGGREEGAEPAMGRVGPYRLTRLLGRGGMGVVYLGEREADGFRLEAAIKVVATGFESESARERFLRERRILAGLRHPHIASLFDGGFSEEGAPYFVMEYVEGDPIHRFCDQRRLTVRQRVELFLQVVAAVEHAHQNLVIHRDLKPQNVLVTSQGQAKLLDFGIARLLDAGSEEFHTATALPNPMTVAYASPEQIRGRTLSTATDVYGLGLLLYQLVTGRLPYELDGASAGEAERIICTTEPLPPHRAPAGAPSVTGSGDAAPDAGELARRRSVDEARLRRELSGDLERILLMALRKEPERRYASASALADDLRRYLAGLPVSARADTTAYRFRRFVARNRGAVAAGSMLAILALALAGLAVRYTLETRSAAERIAREADITREVTEFLLGVLALSDPGEGRGDTLTVRAALERGVAKYGEVLRDRPELRARMLETMARGYSGLGLDAEAAPLLEETLALRPATGTAADTLRIATLFQISDLYFRRGQYPESVRTGEEALESVAGLGGDSVRIALSLGIMARGLTRVPLLDSARLLGSRALGILRRHAGPDAPSTLQAGLAYAHTLRVMEEPDSAEALLREILAGIEAGGEDVSPLGPEAANNLGYLLRVRGRPAESAKMYRLALDRFDHWMPPTQRLITLNNLAALQDEMGNPSEAEATLRAHLALARETWPGGNWRVGSSASALATLLLWNGRTAEAVPLLQEAMEVYTRTLGPTHGWTANAESRLGKALSEVGRADEAEPLLVGSFETLLAGPGPEDRWTLEALERLTSFLDGQGRAAEASRYRRRIGADG